MSPLRAATIGATMASVSFSSAIGIPNLPIHVRAPANTINRCNSAGGKTRLDSNLAETVDGPQEQFPSIGCSIQWTHCQMSHLHSLPLAPGFFAILVGFFFIVLILRSVRYAYESLGVSSNTAIFLLFATLIGSFFNIPVTELSPERAISHHHVDFFGMRYAVPVVSHWKGTVVAVNVGGAVIPTLMSIYLLIKCELWVKGLVATAIVALVIHWMAEPIPGLGIAVPVFMPVVVTAIVAMILSRQDSAPLA